MAGTQRETILRFLAEPADVNFGGKVHGGMVMKWIDQAAYACAAGWSGCYCVTVYVGGIRFDRPIHIGQMVDVRARLILTGTSSMHLAVEVAAQDLLSGERVQATRCVIVFVAVDASGRPTPVPHWEPQTDEDRALSGYATRLMRIREEIESQANVQLPPA
jgi:acyl-CoA hydrolase